MASGKARPHASCLRASQDSSPLDAGAYDFVWSRYWNLRIPLRADMDLGELLESPQGRQSSSLLGVCTFAFFPSCSSSVTLPFAWIKGSGAFPRGFPTGLSHVPPWCESILGLKFEAVQGNRFPRNGLRHRGTLGMVARHWSSSPFPVETASS